MKSGRLAALLVALVASGAALVVQTVVRVTWQIRSLPERVMEWLLLFVPLDLFEGALASYGADAKQIALVGTIVAMALLLVVIGALAVSRGWTSSRMLAVGVALWLLAMVVVMPITGAGFFATRLLFSPLLTSTAYLVVFLGYASVLIASRSLIVRERRRRQATLAERRALIAGLIGTLGAGGLAWFVGREGGLVASTLPLATVPTRTPAPPTAVRTAVMLPEGAQPATPAPQPAVPTVAVAPPPTAEALPDPGPGRKLARDKDGSLTAAGRAPGELAPSVTANADFYVVTKNAVADPVVDAGSWRLVIDGEVNRPVQLDYRALRNLPAVEVTKTLECISNFTAGCTLTSFGCDLISTARWRGARLSDVLDLAGGLKSTAVGLAFVAVDEFSAGLPIDVADDGETLVAYEMNGQPLPREHGFPARLLVPGRYGMKDPKWLAGIHAMNQEYAGWYEQRNWDSDGIVKTMSRIDVPVEGARLPPGEQRVAGIAYAGDRGISLVEVSPDDGETWLPMRFLEPMPGRDAMVRWEGTFRLETDERLTLTVRATDGPGEVQTDDLQLPQPSGASGRDQVTVSAA